MKLKLILVEFFSRKLILVGCLRCFLAMQTILSKTVKDWIKVFFGVLCLALSLCVCWEQIKLFLLVLELLSTTLIKQVIKWQLKRNNTQMSIQKKEEEKNEKEKWRM